MFYSNNRQASDKQRGQKARSCFIWFPVLMLCIFVASLPARAENLKIASASIAIPDPAASTPTPIPVTKPYTQSYVGKMGTYVTKYEDTFVQIARDNQLGFIEVRAANPDVDPWIPGEGKEITLPGMHLLPDAPREGIIINLPEMRLYAFIDIGEPPQTFPIGVGRVGLETPVGRTKVVRKKKGPAWRPTKRMREEDPTLPVVVPAGPENPLGTHAMYLGWPQYAIHGTNRPFGIGRRVSSGCIRLYPKDIIHLFGQIEVGTPVTVVDQSVKVGWVGDNLYMEAHPSLNQADDFEKKGGSLSYELTNGDVARIMTKAGAYVDQLDWRLIRKIIRERQGYPVIIGKKPKLSTKSDRHAGISLDTENKT